MDCGCACTGEFFKTSSFLKAFLDFTVIIFKCVLYFDVVIQWNIKGQNIFPVSLYTKKHLLLNRDRDVFIIQLEF